MCWRYSGFIEFDDEKKTLEDTVNCSKISSSTLNFPPNFNLAPPATFD
jgi:hypothetical protein